MAQYQDYFTYYFRPAFTFNICIESKRMAHSLCPKAGL
ncbi:hypothetical protein P20652_2290 [Pseudoalteromonas sp. BSi20652]|nr:hypothetical protein P20652_2290 [Pseudoalteromonas sp. BSi20652]